jgi:regulator of RNase E activity RraA
MEDSQLLEKMSRFETSVLADAMEREGFTGAMDIYLQPLIPGKRISGTVLTLTVGLLPEGKKPDISALALVPEEAREIKNPVVVIKTEAPGATWGGMIGTAARAAGIRGVIIEGAVRDTRELVEMGQQVFAVSRSPGSIKWNGFAYGLKQPLIMGGIKVNTGDFVFADDDGVVVVPPEKAESVLSHAEAIEKRERELTKLINKGLTFRDAIKELDNK